MNTLDREALELFHAGCSQPVTWDEFTDRQKDHWRSVAIKAREIFVNRLSDRLAIEKAAEDAYAVDHYYGTPWSSAEDLEKMLYRDRAGVVAASLRITLGAK